MQCRSRVEHRYDVPVVDPGCLAMNGTDALQRKETPHRIPTQGDDDQRVNQLNLFFQVLIAGQQFFRQWIAVCRRATLDHVGDEDIAAF